MNLAIALTDQYSYERALNEFSEAIRLNPNYTGDLQRGKQELEPALKLEPDDPEVLKALQMAENALQR